MIRRLISLAIFVVFAIFAFTVPLGSRTLYGHIAKIWQADETRDLVDGVKESAGPLMDRAKRGAKAGWDAFQGDGGPGVDGDAGSGGKAEPKDDEPKDSMLDRARDKASDAVADKAGEMAKDETRKQVKARLGGE